MTMREISITEIERFNVAVLVLGSIGIGIVTRDLMAFFSFVVASAIVTLNFRLLKNIIDKLLFKHIYEKKDLLIVIPLKFILLLGILTVVVMYGNVRLAYFLFGLSTVFISIIISQLRPVFTSGTQRRQDHGA